MALLAEGILKTYWDQSIPVNLARMAKQLTLVVEIGDPGEACAVVSISPQCKPSVTIGKTHSIRRQRYGVAHAIAHIALHHLRPGMRREIFVSRNYQVDHSQPQVSEANDFALRLLIPETVLRATLDGTQVYTLKELAQQFDVPTILIKQRLADLDLPVPKRLSQQLDPAVAWD